MLKTAKIISLQFSVLFFLGFAITFLFGNPRVSYDGWQYLSSAMAIQDGSVAANYFWVRQPGYPLLIRFSFSFGNSIWPLICMQVLLFTASYIFLIWQARSNFSSLSTRQFLGVTSLSYSFIYLFIGGYNLAVLPQSITSSFLMIVSGLSLHFYRLIHLQKRSTTSKVIIFFTFPFLVILGYSIAPILSYLVFTLQLFLITILINQHIKKGEFPKVSSFTSFFSFSLILSVLLLVVAHLSWNSFSQKYINSPFFNSSQILDPFWGVGVQDYLKNFQNDPQILHYIPASFFSLLMLIPNSGWNGLVIAQPPSFHSQNADVGFGLFSTNYPRCIDSPNQVLAVNEKYIKQLALQDSCSLTGLDLPRLFFLPIMLIWIYICVYWLYQIVIRRQTTIILISIVPMIYLAAYAFLGGGIDRYGSSTYPVIAVSIFLQIFRTKLIPRRNEKSVNLAR